jgi:hypothetical protein
MKGASGSTASQAPRKEKSMTDPKSDPSRVQSKPGETSMTETAMEELAELARDLHSLANTIRDRISLASEDSQSRWIELDREVERFRRAVEQEPKDSVLELRETGFALKRRLRNLRADIKAKAK